MPMGVVSDEEFESQLTNVTAPKSEKFVPPIPDSQESNPPSSNPTSDTPTTNAITGEVLPAQTRGRKLGDLNVPDSLRKLIAETHAIQGRAAALELAADFGVSASSVSAYAKGAHSTTTYDKPDQDIISFVRARKNRVTKKALRVMQSALDTLTPEKLASTKAKDAAGIARDMSAIIGNMQDKVTNENNNNGPTFVLYVPPQLDEAKFKAIPSGE